ncbi:MAG: DUF2188 domain-containing protein [bacterium]
MENIIAFFAEWWQYLAIVGGTIVVIVVAFIIFTSIERHAAVNSRRIRHVEPRPEPRPEPVSELVANPVAAVAPASKSTAPAVTDTLLAPEPTPTTMPETTMATNPTIWETATASLAVKAPEGATEPEVGPHPEPIDATTIKSEADNAPTKPVKPVQPKPVLGKYHVLYRPEDGKWYVKREGSQKIIKVLETQTDAINWTTIRALTQDIGMVVHKKDGKIRKMP